MRMSRYPRSARLALLAVPIIALSSTAACGGSSGTSSTPSKAASASSPASTPPSASASSSSAASANTVAPVPVESNPPGDIPDNLAFVRYSNKSGGYAFTHPEGWAQTGSGVQVRFTDKLNGVHVASARASRAPTVSSARAHDVPRLNGSVPAFQLRGISAVTVPGGKGVRIVFRRNSDADPVTGRVYRDEVQEYLVFSSGRLVQMDLFGPVGADNVDAYRTMSQSLSIR
ncbi:MAG: PsbP-related protein [Marmoricola sp.]